MPNQLYACKYTCGCPPPPRDIGLMLGQHFTGMGQHWLEGQHRMFSEWTVGHLFLLTC